MPRNDPVTGIVTGCFALFFLFPSLFSLFTPGARDADVEPRYDAHRKMKLEIKRKDVSHGEYWVSGPRDGLTRVDSFS